MVKIYPVSFHGYQNPTSKKTGTKSDNIKLQKRDYLLGAAALGYVGVAAYVIFSLKNKSTNFKPTINNIFPNETKNFAKDVAYRTSLAKGVGIGEKDLHKLNSFVGPQEYKNIIKEFGDSSLNYTPGTTLLTGKKDDYILEGVKNKTFRATLHTHTNHSDGKGSVAEILEQAAKYADEVAENLKTKPEAKAKDAPFTIAITDHDTFEGCKEAVKIISENPEKFKNLKVVLGCEVTTQSYALGNYELKKPINSHIVVSCINPFDNNLGLLFESAREARAIRGEFVFNKCIDKINQLNPDIAKNLSYEDATKFDKPLKTGVLNPYYSIDIYFSEKLKNLEENEKTFLLEEIRKTAKELLPTMEKSPMDIDFVDLFRLFKNNDVSFTLAHPALTDIGNSLKDPSKSVPAMLDFFKMFKSIGKEKSVATEIYYPYFGELAKSKDWLELMTKGAKENNLEFTGGLDTHGKSIFYSKKS